MDLFGSDDGDAEEMKRIAEEQKAKAKKKKAPPVAKSIVLLDIKPWGPEENLDALAEKIFAEIKMDGLLWKTEFKKEPVAFGVWKLVIGCTVEDEKVGVDDLIEKI